MSIVSFDAQACRLTDDRPLAARRSFGSAAPLALACALAAAFAADPAHAVGTPFTQNGVTLTNLATEITYNVDFSTLPLRPNLIVEATPDAAHADMALRLEVANCNFEYPNPNFRCDAPGTPGGLPRISDSDPGSQSVDFQPWRCGAVEEFSPPYVGKSCDVKVRALSFGSAPAPATFNIVIRGETVVPSSTISVDLSATTTSIAIPATKDTTIYQANTGSSNGQGDSIWTSLGTGANEIHGLLAFDVPGNVPAGATILDARIELQVISTTGATPALQLYPVLRNGSVAWPEGSANAGGDESTPPTAVNDAASWSHRQWKSVGPLGAWTTAGGDRQAPSLRNTSVTASGLLVLQSAGLLQHVQTLYTNTTTYDGLMLFPLSGGVRFASAEHPTVALRPRLVVDYFVPTVPVPDEVATTTAEFINEGQNFRWIYDDNADRIVDTAILGRCTWSPPSQTFITFVPYTYQYRGQAPYTGLDCCTWQIDSSTGVTGAGQAIFYLNVSSTNPAYQPGDLDVDGIKDLCDNCPSVPNGPLRGTCLSGPKKDLACHSTQDCSGSPCSLAQEDLDQFVPGDACVPEPGLGVTLGAGLALVATLGRRRLRAPA